MIDREAFERVLSEHFAVEHLVFGDESARHKGHAGVSGQEGVTHVTLCVVSPDFKGLSRVERHKKVKRACAVFFERGLHALSLTLLTPEEYQLKG